MESAPIPDILHKYGDENLLYSLANENLMFSMPSDCNDPFEFLPSLKELCKTNEDRRIFTLSETQHFLSKAGEHTPGFVLTEAAQKWRSTIEQDWFITSFTKKDGDPRMWAQYGGNHKGLQLTLDFSHHELATHKSMLHPVSYCHRTRHEIFNLGELPKLSDALKFTATTKGPAWSHEEEVRWLLRDQDSNPLRPNEKRIIDGKMRAFITLPHACISKVTLGYYSSNALRNAVIETRKLKGAKWQVSKAKLSLDSFEFEEEPIYF
jgi:hypothetical protein